VARKPQVPQRDLERVHKVLQYERRSEPKFRRPGPVRSCLVLLIALAIAGAIVYYVCTRREQFAELWHRATHPDSVPGQVVPGQ